MATTVEQRQGRYVGRGLRRREDERVLRGQAQYVDDIEMPGMAHIAFVRSPHAHARVGSITVGDLPTGVLAVITPSDLDGRVQPFPRVTLEDMEVSEDQHPILAGDEVRYVGQPVAAVVAESRALAEDGAEAVVVDYEPLDAVVDPYASEHAAVRWSRSRGDVEGAFSGAAHVVSGRYGMPRLTSVPMEPRGAVARDDPGSGVITIWSSSQDPHRPLSQLSHILMRPDDTIRLIVPDVGGAFGTKGNTTPEVAVTAIAAIDLARPVKWIEDRLENFLTSQQARGIWADVELALDADGAMRAIRARIVHDLGGYLLPSTHIPLHTAGMLDDRLLRHPGGGRRDRRRAHAQGPDRSLPRRGAPGGGVLRRADRRRRRAGDRDGAGRAAPAQRDPLVPASRPCSAGRTTPATTRAAWTSRWTASSPIAPRTATACAAPASRSTSSARAARGRAPT